MGGWARVGGLEEQSHRWRRWAICRAEPDEASEWLQSFDEGPTRDLAVAAFSRRISAKDPQGAWDWAASISDPNRRNSALERVARTMLDLNREESEAVIRNTELLSEETKWQLLDQ